MQFFLGLLVLHRQAVDQLLPLGNLRRQRSDDRLTRRLFVLHRLVLSLRVRHGGLQALGFVAVQRCGALQQVGASLFCFNGFACGGHFGFQRGPLLHRLSDLLLDGLKLFSPDRFEFCGAFFLSGFECFKFFGQRCQAFLAGRQLLHPLDELSSGFANCCT